MPRREHLRRLPTVWVKQPICFLTVCTHPRRPILTGQGIPAVLTDSWRVSLEINGWAIGQYVVMPDHVHFFARPLSREKPIGGFMRDWKRWTAGEIIRLTRLGAPIWQPEFFDHVLRSAQSYGEKWAYVRENPVRAGLVATAEDWTHSGECEVLRFKL